MFSVHGYNSSYLIHYCKGMLDSAFLPIFIMLAFKQIQQEQFYQKKRVPCMIWAFALYERQHKVH